MRVDRLRDASVLGGKDFGKQLTCFYVFPVIVFQQIRSMDVIHQFPCVIALGLSSPLDQILQGMTAPKVLVIAYCFDFVLFFAFDQIWRWLGEIWPMLCHFMIGQ
jgi:hypothetical protein